MIQSFRVNSGLESMFLAVKRKYGLLCQEIQPRDGNRYVEHLEAKIDILKLMDQMFEYRTKVGFTYNL